MKIDTQIEHGRPNDRITTQGFLNNPKWYYLAARNQRIMALNRCCYCGNSQYEVNEGDDGNYLFCTLKYNMDTPCGFFVKRVVL